MSFDKFNNVWKKKTTNVIFKQHGPQSVAELSGVAGALEWEVLGTIS